MLGVFAAIFWGTFSSMGIVVTPGWGSRGADLGTKKQGGINTEATSLPGRRPQLDVGPNYTRPPYRPSPNLPTSRPAPLTTVSFLSPQMG